MYRHLIILTFVLMFVQASAQTASDSTTVFLGIQGHYGFILPHSRELIDFSQTRPRGIQAELSRIRRTQEAWNSCNCISQNGIVFGYYDFNDPEVLGKGISAAFFAEPILTYGKVLVSLRAGAGLVYLTRVYDADKNPTNLFFSSPLSGLLMAQVNARIPFSTAWAVRVGGTYQHISNGGIRKPNKGMNFPMLGIGIEHSINPLPLQSRSKNKIFDRNVHFYTGLFATTRSIEEEGTEIGQRKLLMGIQAGIYRRFAYLNAIGAAMEFSYDNSLRLSTPAYNPKVISTLIRHHLLFGKFDFSQGFGIYMFKDYPVVHRVFQRYAIDYQLIHVLKIGFSLKAHGHVAEQMDIRITAHF
jgi:hypothetical protein